MEGKRVNYSESDRKFWRDQHERVEDAPMDEIKKRNLLVAAMTGITAENNAVGNEGGGKKKNKSNGKRVSMTSMNAGSQALSSTSSKKVSTAPVPLFADFSPTIAHPAHLVAEWAEWEVFF